MRRVTLVVTLLGLLTASQATAAENHPAPSFRARTIAGKTVVLDTLRARGPVLLDFWATWCKPCVAAIPELQQLYEKYEARGLTIVGISVDGPRNFAKVRPFAKRNGITYPVVLDENGSLQEKYHVSAMPTTVLVDPSGAIVRVKQGYRPGDATDLAAAIEAMLAPPAPPATDSPSDSSSSSP